MLWRDPRRAGWLMTGYFLIALAVGPAFFVKIGTGSAPGLSGYVTGSLAVAFLAWRVTRGGRISRMLLILCAGGAFLETALVIATRFGPLVFALLIGYAAQLAVLLSPAVYRRTRPPDWTRPTGWSRVRPPAALLLLAALAGLTATLLGLGHLVVTGGPAVADGYPLTWLTVHRGALVVNRGAALKNLTGFTVVSASVLYGLWLGPRTRPEPTRSQSRTAVIIAIIVGSVLGGLAVAAAAGFPLSWVTASQYAPVFHQKALLADTALWSLGFCAAGLAAAHWGPYRTGR